MRGTLVTLTHSQGRLLRLERFWWKSGAKAYKVSLVAVLRSASLQNLAGTFFWSCSGPPRIVEMYLTFLKVMERNKCLLIKGFFHSSRSIIKNNNLNMVLFLDLGPGLDHNTLVLGPTLKMIN